MQYSAILAEKTLLEVDIDYDRTIEQMVEAGGYDYADPYFNGDNFPIVGQGKVHIHVVLFHFNMVVTKPMVITEMKRDDQYPSEPARTEALLAVGEHYPKLQKEFPIIARGHSDTFSIPYLRWSETHGRILGRLVEANIFEKDCVFLGELLS